MAKDNEWQLGSGNSNHGLLGDGKGGPKENWDPVKGASKAKTPEGVPDAQKIYNMGFDDGVAASKPVGFGSAFGREVRQVLPKVGAQIGKQTHDGIMGVLYPELRPPKEPRKSELLDKTKKFGKNASGKVLGAMKWSVGNGIKGVKMAARAYAKSRTPGGRTKPGEMYNDQQLPDPDAPVTAEWREVD